MQLRHSQARTWYGVDGKPMADAKGQPIRRPLGEGAGGLVESATVTLLWAGDTREVARRRRLWGRACRRFNLTGWQSPVDVAGGGYRVAFYLVGPRESLVALRSYYPWIDAIEFADCRVPGFRHALGMAKPVPSPHHGPKPAPYDGDSPHVPIARGEQALLERAASHLAALQACHDELQALRERNRLAIAKNWPRAGLSRLD